MLAATAVIVTSLYCFREGPIHKHLYSTLSVYGACLVAIGVALFGMTSEWRPLTYNLRFPILTFSSSLVVVMTCVGAHALYAQSTLLRAFGGTIRQAVYKPMGLLRVPSDIELWVLGAIGVFAVMKSGVGDVLYGVNGVKSGEVGGKFLQSLNVFTIAPYIIILKSGLVSNKPSRSLLSWWLLAGYSIVILGLAMAQNARGTFAEIILIIGICLMAMVLKGSIRLTTRTWLFAGAVLIAAVPCMGLIGNLSEAMKIVRGDRYSLSTGALVTKTLETMAQPDLIKYMREQDNVVVAGYNEIYFSNEFLTRFSITKFTDNNWESIGQFPEVSPALRDRALYDFNLRTWGLLPTPVLRALHIDIDKDSIEFLSSSGDFYANFASIRFLGGFITGSVIPDSYVLFGFAAPFFFFSVFVLYFIFMDSFLSFDNKGNSFVLAFSIMLVARIFQSLLLPEGFYAYPSFFIRALPQLIIFYALITQGTNLAINWVSRPAEALGGIRPIARLTQRKSLVKK